MSISPSERRWADVVGAGGAGPAATRQRRPRAVRARGRADARAAWAGAGVSGRSAGNSAGRWRFSGLLVWLAACAVFASASAVRGADDKAAPADKGEKARIQVSADRLVAKMEDNVAEFIGNVHVTQGEATLKADRVTIYTKKAPKGADPATAGMESIDRIVAAGSVTIDMQDGTAVAEQAEYRADKRVIILSGPGTKVTKAGNSIAGSKITLYRDDGRVNVDGSDRQRVQAVFVTEGGVLE